MTIIIDQFQMWFTTGADFQLLQIGAPCGRATVSGRQIEIRHVILQDAVDAAG
jgi:hypothetical protein